MNGFNQRPFNLHFKLGNNSFSHFMILGTLLSFPYNQVKYSEKSSSKVRDFDTLENL